MDTPINLDNDLKILERFAELTPHYLNSEALFYPTGPNIPEMTFGGILLRQHRLLLLTHLLSPSDRYRLDIIVANFQAALDNNIVRFEKKCYRELDARLRQWKEYLRDLQHDKSAFNYYKTAVEPRVMIDVTLQQLNLPPYSPPEYTQERVLKLDVGLRMRWLAGDFIWDPAWEPAYPAEDFWYLYGSPA
jgi:hypothetical protein